MRALNITNSKIKNFLNFNLKIFDSLIGEIQR